MSQTSVAVTPGSGKNIDGFSTGGTGNVRQAVVIGDPSTDANIAAVTSNGLKVDVSAAALPNHQSVNVDQLNGTTADTNSGSKSAGTLRVVLATDQPQLTNKLLVTPDANSAVNVAQFGGSNVVTVATGVPKIGTADSNGVAILSAANALNSTGAGVQAAQAVGQFDDTSPTSITENQFGNLRMSANRNLYNTIRDAAGNERGANVNASNELSVSVDNTVTVGSHNVTNAGTFAVQATVAASATNIAKAEDVASADSDVGVPAMAIRKATPANTSGTDGDYEMLQISAGRLWVDASGKTLTVDGSGVTQPVSIAATVATAEVAPTTISNGKTTVTTAGTRVTLASSTTVKSVTIKALSTNTGFIYVGNTSVASTNGFQLSAGDSISMDISNLNTINIDSSVNGEGVTYIGVN